MTGLAVILLIVGIVLLLLGVFIEAAQFLLWDRAHHHRDRGDRLADALHPPPDVTSYL